MIYMMLWRSGWARARIATGSSSSRQR